MGDLECPVVVDRVPCESGQRMVLGLCLYHYRQRKDGRPFARWAPRRRAGSAATRDPLGRKLCTRCEAWLSPEQFGPSAVACDGLQAWCMGCSADYMLRRRYGLTRAEVDAIVAQQGGCAICGGTPPLDSDYRRAWQVDHDHSCCPGTTTCGACIRGVLCAACNSLIGHANDDPERLRKAANYCERRHQETP